MPQAEGTIQVRGRWTGQAREKERLSLSLTCCTSFPNRCQEDDRQFLIRQIVTLKQDNKRLTSELANMANDMQEVGMCDMMIFDRAIGLAAEGIGP